MPLNTAEPVSVDYHRPGLTKREATGYVEGIGWLEAWGTSLITALEALQALAAQRDVPPLMHAKGDSHV